MQQLVKINPPEGGESSVDRGAGRDRTDDLSDYELP